VNKDSRIELIEFSAKFLPPITNAVTELLEYLNDEEKRFSMEALDKLTDLIKVLNTNSFPNFDNEDLEPQLKIIYLETKIGVMNLFKGISYLQFCVVREYELFDIMEGMKKNAPEHINYDEADIESAVNNLYTGSKFIINALEKAMKYDNSDA